MLDLQGKSTDQLIDFYSAWAETHLRPIKQAETTFLHHVKRTTQQPILAQAITEIDRLAQNDELPRYPKPVLLLRQTINQIEQTKRKASLTTPTSCKYCRGSGYILCLFTKDDLGNKYRWAAVPGKPYPAEAGKQWRVHFCEAVWKCPVCRKLEGIRNTPPWGTQEDADKFDQLIAPHIENGCSFGCATNHAWLTLLEEAGLQDGPEYQRKKRIWQHCSNT